MLDITMCDSCTHVKVCGKKDKYAKDDADVSVELRCKHYEKHNPNCMNTGYAVLKCDKHTWNRVEGKWDVIHAGTKGRIIDFMLVTLSITYRLIFNEWKKNCTIEYVNEKDLEFL